ncbi:MAG: hypothetical protein HZA92_13145 [Verrucomicrobia bacterium]|nr:hypothetical protein [Verrucomicrobiota bacterium]
MNHAHAATWEKLPSLPEPNGGCMAGCVGGKIIVVGGTNWRDDMKRWLDTVRVFDPATKQWAIGPSLPHPLAYAAFASDGARLYMAGGADGKRARREVYGLDANLKLVHIGDLPMPVVFAGGALQGGRLAVFGGTPDPDDWSKVTADLHAVNLTNGISSPRTPLTGLSHGVGIPAVAVAGGGLYTFTGAWLDPASQQVRNVAAAFTFDFASNSWRPVAPCPKPARGVSAVALDDSHIYLAGGHGTDAEGFLSTAFIYNASKDRHTPALPLPLAGMTCLVRCGEFVYALGGEDRKKHRSDACFRIRAAELLGETQPKL